MWGSFGAPQLGHATVAVAVAFQVERRVCVFARDILYLGSAIVFPQFELLELKPYGVYHIFHNLPLRVVGVGWMRDGVRGMGAWWARYRYAREPSAVTNTITNTNPIMGLYSALSLCARAVCAAIRAVIRIAALLQLLLERFQIRPANVMLLVRMIGIFVEVHAALGAQS